jgi:hypothetical protein
VSRPLIDAIADLLRLGAGRTAGAEDLQRHAGVESL